MRWHSVTILGHIIIPPVFIYVFNVDIIFSFRYIVCQLYRSVKDRYVQLEGLVFYGFNLLVIN